MGSDNVAHFYWYVLFPDLSLLQPISFFHLKIAGKSSSDFRVLVGFDSES